MIVLAHAGHWLVQVAYFLPVLAFLAWLAFTTVRERRRDRGWRAEQRWRVTEPSRPRQKVPRRGPPPG